MATRPHQVPEPLCTSTSTRTGWLLLGFALGGFFDGILLHQILQWHHLLSGLDDPAGSDLHFQIVADGLFHLLMYVLAIAGAILVLKGRRSARAATTGEIIRLVLIGFGVWHIIDAVVSHWLLGIHRIRMDSDAPLVWDIAWLAMFGILPLLIAYFLPPKGGASSRRASATAMSVVLAAGIAAASGPRFSDVEETIVVFRKDLAPHEMMSALLQADASMRWTDASGTIWAVDDISWRGLASLYANGALLVGASPVLGGCLAWTRPA